MKFLTNLRHYFHKSDKREAKLISGEQPLVAFISSVMNGELGWARDQAKNCILSLSGFPWLFEYTPASSEEVEDGYLRKVRESDLVIWLIGASTTNPVEAEIREALSADVRLLAFLLPVKKRDEKTEKLIEEVGTKVKWAAVNQPNDFSDVLDKSISDEIIRALRNKPGMSRLARLKELMNASRARCLASWQATGLSLNTAIELYEDASVGAPPTKLVEALTKTSLIVLTGDFGAGKSLMTERIFQSATISSLNNSSSPIPIYLKSQEAVKGLEECIKKHSIGLGNPRIQGTIVIVDGADEAGISASDQLLNEARVLGQTWPNTLIIISSRTLPILAGIEENIKIENLSEQEIQKLVSRVSKIDVTPVMLDTLPTSIRDAISRPFFSLLWGNYLRNHKDKLPETIGQLIEYLVEKSVPYADDKIIKTLEFLELIGAKSIDNRGTYVPWRGICNEENLIKLLETRLVEKVGDRIGFPLPILTQWFAAHSLVNRRIEIVEIAKDIPRLDKWFYPLIIIVGLFPFEKVTEIIAPVVENNPAIAGEIIKEATDDFRDSIQIQSLVARECAKNIRLTYQIWIKGLGNLANYITPISDDKELNSTGVIVSDNKLVISWYRGKHKDGDIVELPVGYWGQKDIDINWEGFRLASPNPELAWAWRWSRNELVDELERLLARRAFVIDHGYIYKEMMWGYALQVLGYGDLHSNPILLDMLELAAKKRIDNYSKGNYTPWHELYKNIKILRENGDLEFAPPWPSSDLAHHGGWIWEPYSDEQVLNRARFIYDAAIDEYNKVVDTFFIKLKPRMLIATLLPTKINGEIIFTKTSFSNRSPQLNWYFEPLPIGNLNSVNFSISGSPRPLIDVDKLYELNRRMRPQASEWITAFTSFSSLDIFQNNPITTIVYKWLKDDLRRISWA